MSTFHIFSEYDFDAVMRGQLEKLKERIRGESSNYLLNVNRTEYLDHIAGEYEIDPLNLDFDRMSVSTSEKMIPAEHFPFNYSVYAGKSYPKPVVKYHIPFSGDDKLLRCVPNPRASLLSRLSFGYAGTIQGHRVGERATLLCHFRNPRGHRRRIPPLDHAVEGNQGGTKAL